MRKKETSTSCAECGWPILMKGAAEGHCLICPSCGMEMAFRTFKVDERLYELLKTRAKEEGVSLDELTGEAFAEYIEECERIRKLSRQDF